MKQFLKPVLAFLIPILILGICCEILLRRIPNNYSYKRKYLDSNAQNVKILVLGSSHSYWDIMPELFQSNSFNDAYNSQTLDFDLEILKKYDHKWDSLKYIIETADFFSLYSRHRQNAKEYNIYYGLKDSYKIEDYSEILGESIKTNAHRLYDYYIKKQYALTNTKLGWATITLHEKRQDLISTGQKAAKKHSISRDRFFNENLETVRSMIEFAKAKNVSVLLVTMPACKSYLQGFSEAHQSNTIKALMTIDSLYDNCIYVNFLTDKMFTESDFFDADHLNETGAKKLTLKIDSLIMEREKKTNQKTVSGKM